MPGHREKMERFLRLVVGGMRAHIQQTSKADWMQEYEVAYDAMAGASPKLTATRTVLSPRVRV